MELQLICNPTAGNGLALETAKVMEEKLKAQHIPYTMMMTERVGHATVLAAAAALKGYDTVAAIGGDGTLLEVASGLCNSKTSMGIIPAGTGNDFIKTVGIPNDPLAALDIVLNTPPVPTDTVRINNRIFLNETGTGFDVMVLDYAEKVKKRVQGIWPYLYGVLCTIFHFKSVRMTLSLDGGAPEEKELLVLAAGNGRYIGGGIPIAPDAVVDDGLLDVVLVRKMNKLRMLCALSGLMKGKILTFKETTSLRVKKLSVAGQGLRINIDGEIITADRADIEVLPGSLLVRRPAVLPEAPNN